MSLVASSAVMFVVLYPSHGFSSRIRTALASTFVGLVVVAGLGWAAVHFSHLSGVTGEDDYAFSAVAPDLRLTAVVICGVVIAGLGVLNDVTITQSSAVGELHEVGIESNKLYSSAMRIGRDHSALTIYTMAFATAAAALPALLFKTAYPSRSLLSLLASEQLADELVRALVGSIGLLLAVPLTTLIADAVVRAGRSASLSFEPAPLGWRTYRADCGSYQTRWQPKPTFGYE